jgi:DNA-binding IclR family transcriptional regulator
MITLNNYEIAVLGFLFKHSRGAVSASEIVRLTKIGLFKVRRALDSLERKRLVRSLERSRSKPYLLTERGMAFAWFATLKESQVIDLFKRNHFA